MRNNKYRYLGLLLPFLLGVFMLFLPLVRDFHVESALIAATLGSFWAAIRACRSSLNLREDFREATRVLAGIFLIGLPLFLYSFFTGCLSVHGIGFWLLYPVPSVYLGYAVGRLLRHWNIPYRRFLSFLLLFVIAAGVLLFELMNYPQVYFFNHIWGGWPGPIYDEVIEVGSSLLFFRTITLFWILLVWQLPLIGRSGESKWIVIFSGLALLISYTQMAEMGIISPRSWIQQQLGSERTTRHFELYYDDRYYSENEIDLLAVEHEFFYQILSDTLGLEPEREGKIESYLYGHAWQKKNIVGAKYTSFVPIWLEQDQLHIARQQLDGTLQHELVHVLSKRFGNELFHGSWSIGLVEGLAVALAPDRSGRSTIDQIVAAEQPYPDATTMRNALSPWGFYTGRSGISYTTTGSFVRYLLQTYPVSHFRAAYSGGDLASHYPDPLEQLIAGWHQKLDSVEVDTVDRSIANRIYSRPSLFEQQCPHVVSERAGLIDRYRFHLARRDTTRALEQLDQLIVHEPGNYRLLTEWAYMHLDLLQHDEVRKVASLEDSSTVLQLLYADAFRLSGDTLQSNQHLYRGVELVAIENDTSFDELFASRLDGDQWDYYMGVTYHETLFDSLDFEQFYYRTKVRQVLLALEEERWDRFKSYARMLLDLPLDPTYFEAYLNMIHQLAFLREIDLAEQYIGKLEEHSLRLRYRERLEEERAWIRFIRTI
ncbi:MAG: hypothetical protein R3211_02985 [Balneolaceae bacterium]|nr:hypothetical protein [Balneolaceae bacterium]